MTLNWLATLGERTEEGWRYQKVALGQIYILLPLLITFSQFSLFIFKTYTLKLPQILKSCVGENIIKCYFKSLLRAANTQTFWSPVQLLDNFSRLQLKGNVGFRSCKVQCALNSMAWLDSGKMFRRRLSMAKLLGHRRWSLSEKNTLVCLQEWQDVRTQNESIYLGLGR